MAHERVLDPGSALLLIVDVQEAFRMVIPEFALVASRISTAARGFALLDVPIVVTEQYPKGLGNTAEEIQLALPDNSSVVEKTAFSACGASEFMDLVETAGAKQIVICGLETHICVSQTTHDLIARGFQVHVLTDCVCSRSDRDKSTGLAKMQLSGAVPSTMEMALFELMRDSGHANFRKVQALIK